METHSFKKYATVYTANEKLQFETMDKYAAWYILNNNHIFRPRGPSIILHNFGKYWANYGKLHRVTGPAVIYYDGQLKWCLNDQEFDDFNGWLAKNHYISKRKKFDLILKYS